MAKIDCKSPGCPAQVDTTLGCTEVSALFGLRIMLEHHIENPSTSYIVPEHELNKQLKFVNEKLVAFKIKQDEEKMAISKKKGLNSSNPVISQLYLECPNGHRNFYDVQCES